MISSRKFSAFAELVSASSGSAATIHIYASIAVTRLARFGRLPASTQVGPSTF